MLCLCRLSDYCWTRRIVVWQCSYTVCRTAAARRWVNGDRRCLRVWRDGVVRDSQEINSIILMKMFCVCLFVVVAITTSLLFMSIVHCTTTERAAKDVRFFSLSFFCFIARKTWCMLIRCGGGKKEGNEKSDNFAHFTMGKKLCSNNE